MSKSIIIAAAVFLIQSLAFAQSWVQIDDLNSTVYALANVNDKIYAGGDFSSSEGLGISPHISTYNHNKWQYVGSGLDGTVYSIIGYNNEVIAAGENLIDSLGASSHVLRYSSGQWIVVGGNLNGPVYCLAVYNGELYAGGAFVAAGGITGIAKWSGDGAWMAVGGGLDNPVYAMAVYNGELYAGGEFGSFGTTSASFVAKWNGTAWSIVGTTDHNGVDAPVRALAEFNGILYVGGFFSHAGGISAQNLASWNGVSWSAVGGGVNGPVKSLTVNNNLLCLGGAFTTAGNIAAKNIALWNGTIMSAMGIGIGGTNSEVLALLDYHSDLYVGGTFSAAGGLPVSNVARWSGTANVATLTALKLRDHDGSLATSADRSSKIWNLSIYKDLVNPANLVASGNSSYVTAYITAAGKYIACESDSGALWTRLNGGGRFFDTIQVSLNSTRVDTFINFRVNTKIAVSIDSGWNMLSNPLDEVSEDVQSVFPGAASLPFFYDRLKGYFTNGQLTNGLGFWLKYTSDVVDTISGSDIASISVPVKTGWNMIGSISSPVPVSAITQDPLNNVSSSFYRYLNGYVVSDSIVPGAAYWVKVNQDGQLILQPGGASKGSTAVLHHQENLGSIIVADAAGKSGSLYFGKEQPAMQDVLSFEMPPLPPSGAFDVRFASQKNTELFSDESSPVLIQSARYPLRIEWNVPETGGESYTLFNGVTGKSVASLRGKGGIAITSEIPDLRIKSNGGTAVPGTFALHQNYPNPFNPATTFTFDLPVQADVVLTVYDQLGRVVASLLSHAQKDAGVHSITWDGSQLASGVYFYRLMAASVGAGMQVFHDVKKMVLIK
jgi:hypothetical protein